MDKRDLSTIFRERLKLLLTRSDLNQSAFATYAIATEQNVVVVDKNVDLTMLAPLGCGFQTGAGAILNTLRPEVGSSLAIMGAGNVGLGCWA